MTVWISNIKSKENMKRIFNALGLMLAATLTLTNCTKNIETPVVESEGVPFEIVASTVETKTVNDGMSTLWAAGDQINLFHAVAGTTTYSNDNNFTVNNVETGLFKGTLTGTLAEDSAYDWYAFYPYTNKMTTPANTAAYAYIGNENGLTQNGYDSMAHVSGTNCPLYGVAKAVPSGEMPSLQMHHLSSVIAVKVTNTLETPLKVNEVIFTAGDNNLTGSFYVNIAGDKPTYMPSTGYVSTEAKVTVNNATELAEGESATVYIVIKPFEAYAGNTLELIVNGYKKVIKLEKAVDFEAGKIKTLNFAYDKEPSKGLTLPWYEDFSSKDLSEYTTSNVSFYNEALAGGKAPELFLTKGKGSLSADFDLEGYEGTLTLVYLTNNDGRIKVTSPTEGVTVKKDETSEYLITIPEGSVEKLTVVISNCDDENNVRIDDIRLVKGLISNQNLSFAVPSYTFEVGSDEANAFEGQAVDGAYTTLTYKSSNSEVAAVDASTGKVTLGSKAGNAIISVSAVADNSYKAASASYEITLSAPVSGDITKGTTWTYSFTAKQWSSNGNKTLNGLVWTLAGDGGFWGWDNNNGKGHQFGSSSKPFKTLKLSTSSYQGGVQTIKISTSGASGTNAKLTVTVNGKQYGSTASLTSSNKEYTFSVDEADMQKGEIVFTYNQTSSKALYIKAITIN
jgi:hypothetical protein